MVWFIMVFGVKVVKGLGKMDLEIDERVKIAVQR
jgi:hypothetical protein